MLIRSHRCHCNQPETIFPEAGARLTGGNLNSKGLTKIRWRMSPLENLQKKLPAQFILTLPRIWPTCSAASTLRRPLKQKNKSSPRLASSRQDIAVRFCLLDIERGPIDCLLLISAPFAFGWRFGFAEIWRSGGDARATAEIRLGHKVGERPSAA